MDYGVHKEVCTTHTILFTRTDRLHEDG